MTREELPEVMEVKDIQQFLKISRNTAYDLIKRKEFPTLKIGRLLRIRKESFLEWFDNAS
ncbi:helix-turn-helix domain-containing protein [uncultured Clostridium sp.]|jgi:excisionase family DNA binding protein|uniref:helix-turn-helix domain-containing protein n=1 Tax=uncultured Clostridium sp. TaxID=59620 RepID=UPI0025EF221F|nr:helix-turn-helix domain-containing protein [uncultured Clostridium sp.]